MRAVFPLSFSLLTEFKSVDFKMGKVTVSTDTSLVIEKIIMSLNFKIKLEKYENQREVENSNRNE